MNKNTAILILIVAVIIAIVVWMLHLDKNQKTLTELLNDVSSKLEDIAYRDQVIQLSNTKAQLIEQQLIEDRQPIGFKINS